MLSLSLILYIKKSKQQTQASAWLLGTLGFEKIKKKQIWDYKVSSNPYFVTEIPQNSQSCQKRKFLFGQILGEFSGHLGICTRHLVKNIRPNFMFTATGEVGNGVVPSFQMKKVTYLPMLRSATE